jgi:hypothetical protein
MSTSTEILNPRLPWDGSYLGTYPEHILTQRWIVDDVTYWGLTIREGPLGDGFLGDLGDGVIFCIKRKSYDVLPCIIDDIKLLFAIPRRGTHRITIGKTHHVIYYVPITTQGEVVWETPLSRLPKDSDLYEDSNFKACVGHLIVFCDILALSAISEKNMSIRPGSVFTPVNTNDNTILKNPKKTGQGTMLNKITKSMLTKWLGEDTSIPAILRALLCNGEEDVANTITTLRWNIEKIIRSYDIKYVWYASCIVDRLSQYLI